MKILCIATDRRAAQLAAHALRGFAPDIALSWARNLPAALRWIHDHRDVATVIVEADLQRQGAASFAESLRDFGVTAPVVVVAQQQADLLQIVTSAHERTRAAARDAAICTALQSRLFELEANSGSLTEQVRRTSAALAEAEGGRADDAAAATARESELRARLDREAAVQASLERQLDDARATAARERTDLEKKLAASAQQIGHAALERETLQRRLAEAERSRADDAAAATARESELRTGLDRETAIHSSLVRQLDDARGTAARDAARLQQEIDGLRRELNASRNEAESLRTEATRIPLLQMHVEQGKKDARRQFERAPYPLCRCTRDGKLTDVNHSLASLLGYRKSDDLRNMDFASVFECANDLRWLIERSTTTEAAEAVETTWTTADRRRLHVRLHALTMAPGEIEIAVENITSLREIEARLRHAQRMEAVGRLASEVAVTCDSLLRDVAQGGHQWLSAVPSDAALRNQGEALFGEVTRAAGLLRQFAVYGDRQISALEPVSVQKVLRDIGPVLKRVAGDDVRVVLPKSSAPFDVDVEAERVERILVNVASYARQRMPHGGRIKIDLATTVVDRRFLAKHPDVRPGTHVLLTVTEVHSAIRKVPAIGSGPNVEATDTLSSAAGKPGVDLGALLGLIADCEGHLWMAAEPSGNMTLKIYLPSRDAVPDAAAPQERVGRGRQLARWFRH